MAGGGQSTALVIGGGVAGMQAALDLADNGVYTYLVERESELGGRAYQLSRTYRTHECKADGCCMDYCRECIFTPKFGELLQNANLEILLNTDVESIEGEPGNFRVDVRSASGKMSLDVAAIIVATGSTTFDAGRLPEYGYDRFDDVITFLDLEKLIVKQRSEDNVLRRPSDGKIPETVNILLCVGSRDSNKGNQHCSIVCCTYAIGQAKELKERYPDMEVYIHYMDLRAAYRGFEEFYKEAQEKGVKFLRGRVAEINQLDGHLRVLVENIDTDELTEFTSDLVILAVGQEPHLGSDTIAGTLGLKLQGNGFIKVNGTQGIAVAGCALGPRGIRYSVEEAKRAALEILDFFEGGDTLAGS
ncbi:MAG: CoB--CoM heterodisulfide reductase iron-sulfur subunit A family protein [Thermoplasmata archaeon]|nr:MAG: CoB--CoM heterodisulfide reductase iron-sulfur subunit A family protein [Thermoplasmata archaeon]